MAANEMIFKGQRYHLEFSLNVMSELQKTYGSVGAWASKIRPEDDREVDFDALIAGIWLMINEGIDNDNDDNGTDIPHLTARQVGRIITEYGLEQMARRVNDAVGAATAEEDDGKKE